MASVSVQRKKPTRRRSAIHFLLPARRRSAAVIWWFLPIVMLGGWFFPYLGLLMLGCMVGSFAFAKYIGRYWCGWMCPRGSFFDYIIGRFSRNKTAPAWMHSTTFRIGALIFLMGMMSVQLTLAWPDPQAIGRVFIMLLTVTTVVGIGLGLTYKPRSWCSFCPMGTMAGWSAQGNKRTVTVDANMCNNCSACAKVCPMDLSPQKGEQLHTSCITCEQCVTRCPKKALSFKSAQDVLVLEQTG
jgi:polyferredoxin